ncbi:MAG: DUF3592 domain-containing protein [Bradymonadaceae bacterium]
MSESRHNTTVTYVILIVGLLVAGGWELQTMPWNETSGRVIETRHVDNVDEDEDHYRVRFRAQGRSVEFQTKCWVLHRIVYGCNFAEGDEVPVRYDPSNPTDAILAVPLQQFWLSPFFLVCLLLLGIGDLAAGNSDGSGWGRLLVVGGCLTAGIVATAIYEGRVSSWPRTEGEVVRSKEEHSGRRGMTTYGEFRFRANNRTYEFESTLALSTSLYGALGYLTGLGDPSQVPAFEAGRTVRVRYNPSNPQDAVLDYPTQRYRWTLILGLVWLLSVGGGLVTKFRDSSS